MDLQMDNINSMIRLNIDIAIVMVIWIVQLIIYPAFHNINQYTFLSWHHNYMGKISLLIAPLMITQAIIIIDQCIKRGNIYTYLSLFFMILVWTTTFFYSVPCHNKLQSIGYNANTVNILINTIKSNIF